MSEPPVYIDEQPELDYGSLPERPGSRFVNELGNYYGDGWRVTQFAGKDEKQRKLLWVIRKGSFVRIVCGSDLRSGHFTGTQLPKTKRRPDDLCVTGCGRRRDSGHSRCKACYLFRKFGWAGMLVDRANRGAPGRGLISTISVDDVLRIRPEQGGADYWAPGFMDFDNPGSDHFPSLDRLDNNRGYEPDNIVLTTWPVNRMRNDMDPIRFINFLYAKRMTTKAHVQKVYQQVQQMKLQFPKEGKEKAA